VKRKKKKGWTRSDKLTVVCALIGAGQLILAILSFLILIK
jgi:hypothetical protein